MGVLRTLDGKDSDGKRHLAIKVLDREDLPLFCGESWCDGRCGMPALVATKDGREWKAHSSMTAIGPVMQSWRVKWVGEKVQAPDEIMQVLFVAWWR